MSRITTIFCPCSEKKSILSWNLQQIHTLYSQETNSSFLIKKQYSTSLVFCNVLLIISQIYSVFSIIIISLGYNSLKHGDLTHLNNILD